MTTIYKGMRINAYKTLSTLFYHKALIDEIVKKNNIEGIYQRDFEKIISSYIENYKVSSLDGIKKTDEEISNIINSLNIENLKENKLMILNNVSSKVVFSREVSHLVNSIKNEKMDFFESTLTKTELSRELKNLKEYIFMLENYYTIDSERERKDVINVLQHGIEDLYLKIEKNHHMLNNAIVRFVNDMTKETKKVTLAERRDKADELKKHRLDPFQNFLLYSEDPDDKTKKILVSDLIESIANKLDDLNLHGNAVLIYNYNITIKKINNEIVDQSNKLNNIIKSNKKRLAMLEYSNKKIERLEKEMNEQDGYKIKNRNIFNLKMVEEFDFLDNLSTPLYSELINCNHYFLSNGMIELFEMLTKEKIEKPKINEEELLKSKRKIELKEIELKKIKLNEKYKKEIQKRMVYWGSPTEKMIEDLLCKESVDLYNIIHEDVIQNCQMPEGFFNGNMLYSIVKHCLYKLNKNRSICYKIINHVNIDDNKIKPIFKLYKRKK